MSHCEGTLNRLPTIGKKNASWAVVMAQLVEQSLLTPDVRGSNPVISKLHIVHLFTVNCIEKTKIKKKEAGNTIFKNKKNSSVLSRRMQVTFTTFFYCSNNV